MQVELIPHGGDAAGAVRSVKVRLFRTPHAALAVSYAIEADVEHLNIPAAREPRRSDGLWQHTCCEIFIARSGFAGYHELNFSPSGEWALYAFARYRERMPIVHDQGDWHPHITVRRTQGTMELDSLVALDNLSPAHADARLALGLSAVIEDSHGRLSYWALVHPAGKPDFHHPDAFALILE